MRLPMSGATVSPASRRSSPTSGATSAPMTDSTARITAVPEAVDRPV